jgi:hypothetical protein
MKVSHSLIAAIAAASNVYGISESTAAVACSPLEFINARGTGEPVYPTFGIIIGDPLWKAVKKLVPDATGYSVDYPASAAPCSGDLGSQDVINHLKVQSSQCPDQKYALVGYSQGAGVIHQAMKRIDASLYPKIVALVMFGDFGNKGSNVKTPFGGINPDFPPPLAQKLRQNCAPSDPICANDGTNNDAHLSYSKANETYIPDSAAYIAKQLQTNGKAGPQPSPNHGPPTETAQNLAVLAALVKQITGSSEPRAAPKNCIPAPKGT